MSDTNIVIDLGETLGTFTKMIESFENTGELAAEISEIMLSDIGDHFEDEAGPDGEAWTPLAPATIKARIKENKWPGKILQRQGRGSGLLGSLQAASTKTEASVSTNKVYAAIHNLSGKTGRGYRTTIPARPYAYLSTEAEKEIQDAIINHTKK